MSHFISAHALADAMATQSVRVIDCRFELFDEAAGARMYEAGHIPGAVFFDSHTEFADLTKTGQGRHPLPDKEALAELLGQRGFSSDMTIVVYDQTGSLFAARAWWLLRYLGHENVRVLAGGFAAWEAQFPKQVSVQRPTYPPETFSVRSPLVATLSEAEVLANISKPAFTLYDARAPERYRGEVEPLDARAGHIPGAKNLPFELLRNSDGTLKAPVPVPEVTGPVGVYCGSGVSAAYLVLAFAEAGIDGVKLYPGSWSAWSANPDRPIATSSNS